ncbi:MAG: NADH-quinone oxidoreductase subunit L [Candidatus Methylacidiphilales bacterium]
MTWIILLAPLAAALANFFVLHAVRPLALGVSVGACAVSFAGAVWLFFQPQDYLVAPLEWLNFAQLQVTIGTLTDPLARSMLLVVTGVGLLIHVFSLGYMAEDPGIVRFFTKLSLFMFSMLGIVLADNLVMMFIFWELVGLSSYLLIGFWFNRPSAAEAAKKAFLVNRIGDFGFMLGILTTWSVFGAVSFGALEAAVSSGSAAVSEQVLFWMALGLFLGCVGKSAQLPLHVWLPDAMEGPTPVSALIHAATMVAAGVYMLCRVFFLLELSPAALEVIATVGIITAAFAGLIATQQNDIKRILAYSTLSQLGYMVAAVGVAATGAAMFHLTTHAFFKALLFLGAGSVIHALHEEQDIWKMGGLWKKMRLTALCFLAGTLALIACPPFAGFWSKEAILASAYDNGNHFVFWVGLATAFLTAFYMWRLVTVAFFGSARSDKASHAHESPPVMAGPLVVLGILSVFGGFLAIPAYLGEPLEAHGFGWKEIASIGVMLAGVGLAWQIYRGRANDPVQIKLFAKKFYIDELYQGVFVGCQQGVARVLSWIDRWIIDGLVVRGTATGVTVAGEILRLFQGGNAQAYAVVFVLGVGAALLWLVLGALGQ